MAGAVLHCDGRDRLDEYERKRRDAWGLLFMPGPGLGTKPTIRP